MLFLISSVSALEITLNSPTDSTEYDSTSVNLDVDFSELAKCDYTIFSKLPEGESGSDHAIYKLIPSWKDKAYLPTYAWRPSS